MVRAFYIYIIITPTLILDSDTLRLAKELDRLPLALVMARAYLD
jgi:hypothetical protein